MLEYGAGAAWSRLFLPGAGAGADQFGWSRSRLRDLELPELEPPKKVAAPQHWYRMYQVSCRFPSTDPFCTFLKFLLLLYF